MAYELTGKSASEYVMLINNYSAIGKNDVDRKQRMQHYACNIFSNGGVCAGLPTNMDELIRR